MEPKLGLGAAGATSFRFAVGDPLLPIEAVRLAVRRYVDQYPPI